MNKKYLIAAFSFLFIFGIAPFLVTNTIASANERNINEQAEEIYNNMDETEKIAQTLMIHSHEWNGKQTTTVDQDLAEILQKYHFGGFVIFGENTPTTESTFNFVQDLQKNTMTTHAGQSQAGLPLITTPDQEGGAVYRLFTGTCLLGNMATGATFDEQVAKNSGEIISKELNSLGIDSTLAPCVDVNANAGNPVIGIRSFADNAQNVADLGDSFMLACKENGCLAFVKHYPGHGDVATDTHLGKVTNYKTFDELKSTDLIPFAKCAKNCDAIMTAHVQFPNIDGTLLTADKPDAPEKEIFAPATFSKILMQYILRDQIGYDGLACTDAITMKGVSNYFTEPKAVTLALEAGNDMVAEAVNATSKDAFIAQTDAIIAGVKEWVKDDKNAARLKEAVLRVIKTKIKTGIINYNPSNYNLENAKRVLRDPQSLSTEYTDTAKSITLVKNNNNTLPLKVNENTKVLYLTQNSTSYTSGDRTSDSSFAIAWNRLKANKLVPSSLNPTIITFNGDPDMGPVTPMSELYKAIDDADYVITDSGVNANDLMGYLSWQTSMPNEIVKYAHEKGKKSVVVSVRLPYDCQLYPDADAILCTYNYVGTNSDYKTILQNGDTTTNDVCGPNLIEGIEAIFGNINPKGKLPVNVPEFDPSIKKYKKNIIYKNGFGLSYDDQGGQVINVDNAIVNIEYDRVKADGNPKCPAISIKTNDSATITYSSFSNTDAKSFTIPMVRESKRFIEGRDYTLSYNNNIEAGTASVIINGTGSLIGTKTINFEITPGSNEPVHTDGSVQANGSDGVNASAKTSDLNWCILSIICIVLMLSIFLSIRYKYYKKHNINDKNLNKTV